MIPVFPDFISRAIIYSSDEIQEYKIEQHKNIIKIFLKLFENSDKLKIYSKIEKEFHLLFSKLSLKEVKIEFNNYQENDFKRKLKRIERKCL